MKNGYHRESELKGTLILLLIWLYAVFWNFVELVVGVKQ